MREIDFVGALHNRTKRDYVARVVEHDKAECAAVAKRWGEEYWDGPRQYGYGGYRYDGRWLPVAEAIAHQYGLKAGDRILDVGCGKGFLLHEFIRTVPGIEVAGIDVSAYGVANAKEEVRPFLQVGSAQELPFPDASFDFIVSLTTLHNLTLPDLFRAIREIQRVCRTSKKYILVESYRNEREKANLLYWQLTCEAFFTPQEWVWIYEQCGYDGDYGFIYFE